MKIKYDFSFFYRPFAVFSTFVIGFIRNWNDAGFFLWLFAIGLLISFFIILNHLKNDYLEITSKTIIINKLICGKTNINIDEKSNFLFEDSILMIENENKKQNIDLRFLKKSDIIKLKIYLIENFGSKSLEFKRVYNLTHPENKSCNPQIQ